MTTHGERPDRPNLLFIFTDQQRYDTLGCYGNNDIETPNLDTLGAESLLFERTYVTQPVCTPSRATLMTGVYPHTHGCINNDMHLTEDVPTLPEMLCSDSYRTAYMGKWHLGDEIFAQRGFDEWVGVEDAYRRFYSPGRDRNARSDYHHFLVKHGFTPKNGQVFGRDEAARVPEAYSKPAFLAQSACEFLDRTGDDPFVLCLNFLEPHPPYFGAFDDMYDPAEMPIPPNFSTDMAEDVPFRNQVQRAHSRKSIPDEDALRKLTARYWGLVSLVDKYVGVILDKLKANGLDQKTIVVFTSDHGEMMGDHGLIGKTVMYEESVRVPLMIRIPWLERPAQRIAHPVSQIDLMPTLLSALGADVPPHLHGRDLIAAIESSTYELASPVVVEWNGTSGDKAFMTPDDSEEVQARIQSIAGVPFRTIIDSERWKLTINEIGESELYNLDTDSHEMTNRITDPGCRPKVEALAERLLAWQQEIGDIVSLPHPAK